MTTCVFILVLPSLEDRDLAACCVVNKHWQSHIQPCLNERAVRHLNVQRVALDVIQPLVDWDLETAILVSDICGSDTFDEVLQRMLESESGFPLIATNFYSKRFEHHLLTEELFKITPSKLQLMRPVMSLWSAWSSDDSDDDPEMFGFNPGLGQHL